MFKIIEQLVDFIFPRTNTRLMYDSLSSSELLSRCTPAPSHMPRHLQTVCSLFSYTDLFVQMLIWDIKFHGTKRHIPSIAKRIYEEIQKTILPTRSYVLIPVPIHVRRRKERGFNQTEWLCEEIMNHASNCIRYEPSVVTRIVYQEKQSWHNKIERMQNIHNVFCVIDTNIVSGSHIIIIDDVVTTGATILELRRILFEAGAISVCAYTIAH